MKLMMSMCATSLCAPRRVYVPFKYLLSSRQTVGHICYAMQALKRSFSSTCYKKQTFITFIQNKLEQNIMIAAWTWVMFLCIHFLIPSTHISMWTKMVHPLKHSNAIKHELCYSVYTIHVTHFGHKKETPTYDKEAFVTLNCLWYLNLYHCCKPSANKPLSYDPKCSPMNP